ncbi:MAG: metallophosphoesterase [Thermoplasmatota archaeon]
MRNRSLVLPLLAAILFSLIMDTAECQDQAVIITNIEVVTVCDDEAVITWMTNIETTSEVDYGEDESFGNTSVADGESRYHYVKIEDLEPETLYFFQVSSGNARGRTGTFTTLPLPGRTPSMRIAVLADVHFDVDGSNTPNGAMYGDSTDLLQTFLDEISLETDIETVILLGDNVQGSEEDYSGFFGAMDASGSIYYPVMGNWDKSEVGWEDHFDIYVGLGSTYYSIDLGGLHIVVLDSAVPGSVGGSIDDEQLEWLENDLQDNLDTRVLIFMHHLYVEDEVMGLDTDSFNGLESAIAGHGNVLSVFSGHNHQNSYAQYNPAYKTSIASLVQYPIGYATLDIYEEGYSQSFWKVEAALDISESSRMRIKASSIDPEADQEFLGTIEERNHLLEHEDIVENEPPLVLSVSLEDEVIEPGEQTLVEVDAYDPEGEDLEYIYEVEEGTIAGDGPTVTYTASDTEGSFDIWVKVSDGVLFSEPYHVEITIEKAPVTDENRAPEVDRVVVTPQRIVQGANASLRTIASDPDGDPLEYIYHCDNGQIIGEGNEVIWRAPDRKGLCVITVQVSDGELVSEGYLVEIEVYEEQEGVTEDSPILTFPTLIVVIAMMAVPLIAWGCRKRG